MSNPDPNLIFVYSPAGDAIEVSKANARDLVTHSGWHYEKLVAAATPAPAPAPAPVQAPAPVPAADAPVASEGPFTTVEQFAALTEKADGQAYLQKHFPDFKIDGRTPRDKLVAQAIELANGEPVEDDEDEGAE